MKKILNLLLILLLTFTFFITSYEVNLKASDIYSDVLEDLRKDENFDVSKYPSMTLDYINQINNDKIDSNNQADLEVIGIAESSSDELYIYVYQPCDSYLDLVATSISMSNEYSSDGQNIHPLLFELELLSTYTVFDKYLVKDFQVSDEVYRYYNIVSIFRDFNSIIDTPISGTENTGNEIAISVGQQWVASYENNELKYEMGTFETLEIEIDYTGNFSFFNKFSFITTVERGNAWFVAFSVEDYIIKHIYDAILSYTIRTIEKSTTITGNHYRYLDYFTNEEIEDGIFSKPQYVSLTDLEGDNGTGSFEGEGWLSNDYTWDRISSTNDFVRNMEDQNITINDTVKTKLENSQWVFAFLETESSTTRLGTTSFNYYADIEDVTILTLHFIDICDNTYNLGVVSDKVNPDNIPDGKGKLDFDFENLQEMLEKLLALVLVIVLFLALAIFTPLLNIFIKIFKYIFNILIFIICLPFRIIGKLFNIGKNKKP